ncbi:pyruvate kinase-like protein [Aspergillus venezuelensis]
MPPFQDTNPEAVRGLEQPWKTDRLLQVRTGKVKPTFTSRVPSAIYKQIRSGSVKVGRLGCEGDEHAYEFHGGPNKAFLQYSTQHYERWKHELPESARHFLPGAFGENLVAEHANERNVCIGDVVRIGTVIAQVAEPRQPCFKLNHRFEVKDMSKRAQDLFRTGWYSRILQEGEIQAGDEMVLLERPNPDWTVARIQYYLYYDMRNEEAMAEIVKIKELGAEPLGIFQNRLKKVYEDQNMRLLGGAEMALMSWTEYRVVIKKMETSRIALIVLEAENTSHQGKAIVPGSHVRLRLGSLTRAYSVVNGDTKRLELAIALADNSRGGSRHVHEVLATGALLQIGPATSSFPLSEDADKHVFIAGGVGITGVLASSRHCENMGYAYHLHYLVRNTEDIALKEHLEKLGSNVTIYDKSTGIEFNVNSVLGKVNDRAHIYTCGSSRLQDSVRYAGQSMGISPSCLHFESFQGDTTGDPFTAELAESKITVQVAETKTLLDTLREAGFDVPSSCEAGNCGTCRVGVKKGIVEHRGSGLMEEEKGSAMLSCVSRGIGTITLDI